MLRTSERPFPMYATKLPTGGSAYPFNDDYISTGIGIGNPNFVVRNNLIFNMDMGAFKSDQSSEPDITAPSVPQNLNATPASHSQVDLTWNASTDNVGVAGYHVYRDGVEIDTTTFTRYSDTGLNSDTEYTYRVTAYDATGNESAQSSSASANTDSSSHSSGSKDSSESGGGGCFIATAAMGPI